MDLKTPLYQIHEGLGAKLVPFGGFMMPVQYEGIMKEHMAVRTTVGLFDVSHMGEFILTGTQALENIQRLVTNNCESMKDGQIKYSPMCNDDGGIVDDLLVYRLSENKYMLVVNASNWKKDWNWIHDRLFGDVTIEDVSEQTALLALQGPKAVEIIQALTRQLPEKFYTFIDHVDVAGIHALVSRTGYTGEEGFEFYIKNKDAVALWECLMEAGKPFGIAPCGLGARDTLRLEAALPLYGHEMNDDTSPLEAGLKLFVKMDKEDFIGKKAILAKGMPIKKRIGIELIDKGIAREGNNLYDGETEIGVVTSGTLCPFVNKAVAMASVGIDYAEIGKEVVVDVRGRKLKAKVVPLPFYKRG